MIRLPLPPFAGRFRSPGIGSGSASTVSPPREPRETREASLDMADAIQSGVRLEFFGGPVVRGVGTVRALSPTQELLLVLVWGHERPGISRQRAIWLLWEDDDDAPARHRLRQLLSQLRMRLGLGRDFLAGEDVLRADPATTSDLADFRSALRGGDIAAGANLVAKGFAPRIRKLPGPQYEHWLQGKRAGLERDLRAAGLRFWDQGRAMGDWRVALDAAEALLAVEPQAEAALRKVIEARAMTGSLQEAERTVEEFLARKPASYVLEAKTVAQLDRARRTMVKDGAGNDTGPDSPPLVGRTDALETARQVLRRVTDGRFAFLLIRGEAGIGKTRLLEEVRREAGLLGARCLHARPVELEQRIPLNPLIDALDDRSVLAHIETLEHPWKAVVGSVLPRLTSGLELPAVPRIAESSLSRRLYDAFSILFTEIAAEKPTFLFIDDLQWADDTTIAVLQFMQRRWTSGPFGVIAAVRPDLVTGSEGVAKYLADNRKLEVTDIVLRDLEEADALRLLDLISDGRLDRTVRDRLCALGGRNPFYLIELTRDYLKGRLELPELPNEVPEIPISLRQLVDPRIARLTEGAASLAALLSVWGRWIPMVELARLAGEAIEECARQVEELEVLRLATLERSRVRIAHELFRGAIYHSLSEARRSALHHRVAEHLLSTESPLATELAIHFARAGDPTQAARYGREAADEAMDSGAMAEAAHFLEVVADSVTDPRLKAEATADLAQVLHMNREIARADPMLELAASRLRLTGNHRRALRMDIRRVEGLAELGTATMSHLLDRLETTKASARDADDWEVLALALDCELHLLHRSGRVSEIRNLFHEVRECAEKGGPQAACVANGSLALDILFGDGSLALSAGRAAVDLAKKTPECEEHLLQAQSRLFLVLLYRGLAQSAEARELHRAAQKGARTSGDLMLRFFLESNLGVSHLDAGQLDLAEVAFKKAGAILAGAEAAVPRINHYYNLGELAYWRGRFSEALYHFDRGKSLLDGPTSPAGMHQLLTAGIGICALNMGSWSEARRCEAELQPLPDRWYYDPTLLLAFVSALRARRGHLAEAASFLADRGAPLRERLTAAWLKVLLLEVRVARRAKLPHWRDRAQLGVRTSDELNFRSREEEFRALLL
jgi:DNA-binding SARP family transcriptional activator